MCYLKPLKFVICIKFLASVYRMAYSRDSGETYESLASTKPPLR